MATVYQIGVNLSSDATGMEKGMLRAASAVHKFALDFKAIGNIASGVSLAGAIQGATSSFKQLVVGQTEAIDNNIKLAGVLGVTTRNLVGMQHAGDLAGVGTEELGANLVRLQKGIGDAIRDGGELADKFVAMGLNAKELSEIPLDQALQKIANALNANENAAVKSSMAMELFGKRGSKMVTVLAEGSDGLAKATREADALGLVVNDSVAKGVESMNDNLTRTKGLAKGVANDTIGFFAPFIESATEATMALFGVNNRLAEMGETIAETKNQAMGEGFTVAIGPKLSEGLPIDQMKEIHAIMDSMITPAEKLTKQADLLAQAWAFGDISGEEYAAMLQHLSQQLPSIEDPVRDMIDGLMEQASTIGKSDRDMALDKAMNLGATITELQTIVDLFDQIDEAKQDEALNNGLDAFAKNVTESTKTPFEKYLEQTEQLREALEKGKITQTVFDRAMVQADELLEKTKVIDTIMESVRGEVSLGAAFGSQEAAGRIDAFRRSGAGSDKTLHDMLKENRDQTKIQRDLPKAIAGELRGVIGAADF